MVVPAAGSACQAIRARKEKYERYAAEELQGILRHVVEHILEERPSKGHVRAALVECLLSDVPSEDRGPCKRASARGLMRLETRDQKVALLQARLALRMQALMAQVSTLQNEATQQAVSARRDVEEKLQLVSSEGLLALACSPEPTSPWVISVFAAAAHLLDAAKPGITPDGANSSWAALWEACRSRIIADPQSFKNSLVSCAGKLITESSLTEHQRSAIEAAGAVRDASQLDLSTGSETLSDVGLEALSSISGVLGWTCCILSANRGERYLESMRHELKTAQLQDYLWCSMDDGVDPEYNSIWEFLRAGANPHRSDTEGELPISRLLRNHNADVESVVKAAMAFLDSQWGFAPTLDEWCAPFQTIMLRAGQEKNKLFCKMWLQLLKRADQTITKAQWNGAEGQCHLWPGMRRGIALKVVQQLFRENKLSARTLELLMPFGVDAWAVVEMIVKSPTDYSTLLASYLDADVIDVDFKAYDNTTPLILAVEEGNLPIVKVLLQRGAKITGEVVRAQLICMSEPPKLLTHRSSDAKMTQITGMSFHCEGSQTLVVPDLRLTGGRWYYELVVHSCAGRPFVGWSDDRFYVRPNLSGHGVGDDIHSWGANGDLGIVQNSRDTTKPWKQWQSGDVVGCAVDIDAGQTWFALNGDWDQCPTLHILEFEGGLRAAWSGITSGICCLQNSNFACKPPNESFQALGDAPSCDWEGMQALLAEHIPGGLPSYETLQREAHAMLENSLRTGGRVRPAAGLSDLEQEKQTLLKAAPRELMSIWQQFEKGNRLGSGVGGEVFRCQDRSSRKNVAIKIMRNTPGELEEFRKLRYLSHPNILRVFDFLVEGDKLFMVSDIAEGGALYDHISRMVQAPGSGSKFVCGEHWIRGVMEQVVRAVSYCHESGLVHNDLKPDNIFITERVGTTTSSNGSHSSTAPHVVVGDFGRMTSIQTRFCDPAQTLTGDPRYVAPESYRDAITSPKSDVYMIGVMLFELLSGGCLPYFNKPMESWRSVHDLPPSEKEAWWKWLCSSEGPPAFQETLLGASACASEICRSMLAKASAERPSAIGCLEHSFFALHVDDVPRLSVPLVASRLVRHARRNFLQNALANLLVARLENSYLRQARQIFQAVDQRGRGRITCGELHMALATSSAKWDEEMAITVFSAVGLHGQQTLEFNEFAAAILDWRQISPRSLHSELHEVFRTIDSSGGGQISLSDFRKAFPCSSAHEERTLSEAYCALAGGIDRTVNSEDLERFVCEALGVSKDGSREGLAGLEWLLSSRRPHRSQL